jgi:ABC-2 type transport system ATP-binding protein
MLTTLLPIDSGTASVAGSDVGRESKQVRQRIGYVSQAGGADDMSTAWENLILQGRLYGGDLDSMRQPAKELAAVLDLTGFAGRKVASYSGGQRRRLDVALGLVHQPEILFLDEPTTGLDPQNRANLWDHIRAIQERGSTVFLTTHYLEEADALCDRLTIMDHGSIGAEGTLASSSARSLAIQWSSALLTTGSSNAPERCCEPSRSSGRLASRTTGCVST